MTFEELVKEKIKEFENKFVVRDKKHGSFFISWTASPVALIMFLRTFASAIHENDREEFRGMIGEDERVVYPNDLSQSIEYERKIGRNNFRSELTTKLDQWKEKV